MDREQPTVLVVEDTRDVREVLVQLLHRNGCATLVAANGQEALELLSAELPDLVLMDLSMPVLDGWDALTAIRQLPGRDRLPVVAVTAHATSHDRERALSHGFNAYVSKPLDFRQFLDVVHGFLRR